MSDTVYDIRFKNQAEYNAMLAGLRFLAREMEAGRVDAGDDIREILGEGVTPLTGYGIHELADEINSALRNVYNGSLIDTKALLLAAAESDDD